MALSLGRFQGRHAIYLLVFLALSVPLLLKVSAPPAKLPFAEKIYTAIDELQLAPNQVVLVALDFGPNSMAENKPQAEVVIEHLLRKRIKFALYSQYLLAQTFLESIPEEMAKKLAREDPTQKWGYGIDWVNLGVRLGSPSVNIQALAESKNIPEYLKKDARGSSLSDLPAFRQVRSLEDIKLLIQFTSLTNTFESYVQFLKKDDVRPRFFHGCTSITIPKAYIYLDSGQLEGVLEGVAGAAWYSHLLSKAYPQREKDNALLINTGLGVAQLLIIFLVVLGNVVSLVRRRNG